MLLLALVAALPGAHAAGYYFTDAGTRGMARAGAYAVGVEDISAQYYNPAGLMNLSGPQAYYNHSLVSQYVEFTRVDYNEDGSVALTHDPVYNEGKPMNIPAFGVAHNFGLKDWMFALGLHPPFAPDMLYKKDGSQRYMQTDSLVLEFYAGPSVSWRPIPWLQVGGSFFWTYVQAEQSLALLTCTGTDTTAMRECEADPAKYDINVEMKMKDMSRFTGNAGFIVKPTTWLSIGASFLPPVKVKGKGEVNAEFSEDHLIAGFIEGTKFSDNDVTVLLTLPMILRTGVAVRPVPALEIEADAVYQAWHQTKEVRVTDLQLTLPAKEGGIVEDDIVITDDVVIPAEYQDIWSLRLGGEYDHKDWLSLRTGVYWEPSAIPAATQGVSLVDGKKWGFGLGATYTFKRRVGLDVGFSHTRYATRETKDSQYYSQLIPLDFAALLAGEDVGITNGPAVGNGTLKSHSTYVSAGLTVYFGKTNTVIQ